MSQVPAGSFAEFHQVLSDLKAQLFEAQEKLSHTESFLSSTKAMLEVEGRLNEKLMALLRGAIAENETTKETA